MNFLLSLTGQLKLYNSNTTEAGDLIFKVREGIKKGRIAFPFGVFVYVWLLLEVREDSHTRVFVREDELFRRV